MPKTLSALTQLLRLSLSRVVGTLAALLIAGAVALSAPANYRFAAQSANSPSSIRLHQLPNPRPLKRADPTPAPQPAAQPNVVAVAPAQPNVRPTPAQIRLGSGQWGLINQDRGANGLAPLRWSGCLAAIAAQNAVRMAAQSFISHANGVYLDLGCHVGTQAGENIGYRSDGINDPGMNAMFMASPEHRANILGPYHYVGVAWVVAPNGYAYIAVEFS